MNCLVELFLDECKDGVCIKEGEDIIILQNIDYLLTHDGKLIIYDITYEFNKYTINGFNTSKVFEIADDLIKIHIKDKEIYIEML